MKLSYQQLSMHLKKNLLPAYLIAGNEPLLIQEARQLILEKARQEGFSEITRFEANKDFEWQNFAESGNALSLFSEKKLTELKLTYKPLAPASKLLTHFIQNLDTHNILLISCEKLDAATQKSTWYEAMNNKGAIISIWPLEGVQFKHWVEQRLQQHKLNCDSSATQYLIDKTEGNLLATAQEIEKLKLLFNQEHINLEKMTHAIADNARYNIFDFLDIIFAGNVTQIKRVLRKLQQEALEPTLLLWAITREIRTLLNILNDIDKKINWDFILKKYKIWDRRQHLIKKMLKLHSASRLHSLLIQSEKIDHTIKGLRPGNSWDEIEILALGLSGFNLFDFNR